MRRVGIIGLGNVGATAAFNLFTHGYCDEIVLLDVNEAKMQAEAIDLLDTLPVNDHEVKVYYGDWDKLRDADLIIAGFGVKVTSSSEELAINSRNAQSVGPKIKASGFNGIIINIANPCDVITTVLQKTTDLPKQKVFGIGTMLDSVRLRRVISEKLELNSKQIGGFVLGEHGLCDFIAWSTVNHEFSDAEKAEIANEAKSNAEKLIAGKGFTNWAVTSAAMELVRAVLTDEYFYTVCSVYVEEYGIYLGYPAVIGKNGVEKIAQLSLPSDEEYHLQEAIALIKEHLAEID
ncbi:L-lactate dehydrogenase [Lactobacillus mulieris]|uniref:lactate/malate family dehydrogenase n=1 Tax=Lactobacillus mulieris TaxID=2508708 RepID=UPI00065DE707|nr:L-2-hydroxyisocaproate dehydrogenase [Lactobacillus mulieris]MCF1847308.1 L-lactate dehydrogenase [Lactobacillus mulieris]MDK6564409.1 L-lactate dehydrogenase [Lactobacillus mulieris]MDK8083359.1 L-lactate dehydrogenase [Lactobacillus mulieris]NKC43534.1 L-lactate dehydrogenase [Lactobacillus mulieris]WEB31574.1 L-lactate dehydrogenase [Lactobacillus mulieris]